MALFYFLLFVIHHVYFSKIKDTFWIVPEYPQLSQADFFSANMQEIMNIRILKSFFNAIWKWKFPLSQRSAVSTDGHKQADDLTCKPGSSVFPKAWKITLDTN